MTTALSVSHSDVAFFRKRKAMLIFPLIVLPFVFALFYILGGGKGERYKELEAAAGKPGAAGFNASMPTAKNGSIDGRDMEVPGYGKAATGQVLSKFSFTRQDSVSQGLKAIPVNNSAEPATHHSSLTVNSPAVASPAAPTHRPRKPISENTGRVKASNGYYYNPPGSGSYAKGSDQQIESQLRTYEATRKTPVVSGVPLGTTQPGSPKADAQPGSIRLSDNLTASRLAEPLESENPFLTAPTGDSRRSNQAVLTGGNYGAKKVIAWMIPVVVHEDQQVQDGQTVKLRLLKEITVDGVTVPANTILYALCNLSNDRLRLTVQNLQLNGQLIPMDLDVYDTDGAMGVNVPGTSRQVGGQIQSSAIQGIQLPGVGGLVNNVANQARMSASNSLRQTTIRLRAGYNLFLKAL